MSQAGDERPRDDDRPDFGPSGYLPERASKRARKIVLRAPLGMQWVWASIVAGAIVLVAGVVFLTRADDAPAPPYELVGQLTTIGNGEVRELGGGPVLLVTEGGRPRAFDVSGLDAVPTFCPGSRRLEAPGRVWSLTGRGFGTPSLASFPTLVAGDDLYVDLSAPEPAAPPSATAEAPSCAG